MKIAVITRIRNEEKIIQDFLDYYTPFCDGIYIYDDVSNDRTVEICKAHSHVRGIIEAKDWDLDRQRAEWTTRQAVLELAQKDLPDWIIYVDADERIDFSFLHEQHLKLMDGIVMKLFDYYITAEDVDLDYKERKYLGPEYREILMMYKNKPGLKYEFADQREMALPKGSQILYAGAVKHYGKAISVEEWESTCEYYSTHFPEPYKTKWEQRKGKAVHTKSDFGADLITWEMRRDYEYPL